MHLFVDVLPLILKKFSPIKLKSFQTKSFSPEPNSDEVPLREILLTTLKQYMVLENCFTAKNTEIQIVIEPHE